jgi:Tfp pilus assembly protein PilO
VLPPDQSAARRLHFKVNQLASSANVKPERSSLKPSQERDSALGKLTMEFALTGQYRDIRRFIYAVETAPEFLILENVALSQAAENNRGLNVTVQVATYYRAGGDGN